MTQAATLAQLASSGALSADTSGNVGIGTTTPAQKLQVGTSSANDYIQIESTMSISSIEVYSLAGNKVKTFNPNGYNSKINVSELASGSYLLKVNSNDNYKVFNIVIE